jgi:hypothetical protein
MNFFSRLWLILRFDYFRSGFRGTLCWLLTNHRIMWRCGWSQKPLFAGAIGSKRCSCGAWRQDYQLGKAGFIFLGHLKNTGPLSLFFRRLAHSFGLGRLHPAIACWIYVPCPQPPVTAADIQRARELAVKYGWK